MFNIQIVLLETGLNFSIKNYTKYKAENYLYKFYCNNKEKVSIVNNKNIKEAKGI